MALVNLAKWHGAGNDFLVEVIEHGTAPWWTPALARAICDRSTGVGADGLLIATVGSEVAMELYNADGSVAEMSGNGVRCLAAAVRRVTNAHWSSLAVHTLAGVRTVTLSMHDDDHGDGSVDMGRVAFADALDGTLGVANVGNPHVVLLDQEQWDDHDRERVADALAGQLGGANVEFIRVEGADHLSLRVIERGVGWTQACGTGSCAVVAVAHRAGLCGTDVAVDNPGGTLRVTLDDKAATLSGPVQFVANVEWLAA